MTIRITLNAVIHTLILQFYSTNTNDFIKIYVNIFDQTRKLLLTAAK